MRFSTLCLHCLVAGTGVGKPRPRVPLGDSGGAHGVGDGVRGPVCEAHHGQPRRVGLHDLQHHRGAGAFCCLFPSCSVTLFPASLDATEQRFTVDECVCPHMHTTAVHIGVQVCRAVRDIATGTFGVPMGFYSATVTQYLSR